MPANALTPEEWAALGDTRVNIRPEIPAPGDTRPYDFESQPSASQRLQAARQDATRVLEEEAQTLKFKAKRRLSDAEARAQAVKAEGFRANPDIPDTATDLGEYRSSGRAKPSAHPQPEHGPLKSVQQLAEEDAERILGRKPIKPPVTGTMEGKPVIEEMIKVPEEALSKPSTLADDAMKLLSPAEEIAEARAAITRTVADTAASHSTDDAVRAAYKESVKDNSVKRAMREAMRSYDPAASISAKEEAAEAATKTLAQKAAARRATWRMIGTGAKNFALDTVKPITELYTVPRAALVGWNEAGAIGRTGKLLKAGYGLGKGLVKGAAEIGLGMVDEGVLRANYNKLTYGPESDRGEVLRNPGLLGAQADYYGRMAEYKKAAAKQGLTVTGSDPNIMQMLNPFFDQDPNIQVHEDPLKVAARRRMQASALTAEEANAVNPDVRSNSN